MSLKFTDSAEPGMASSSLNQPPPYPVSRNSSPQDVSIHRTQNLSLIIDGERVFSLSQPNRTLYHLSQPVLAGKWVVVGIEKVLYRVKDEEPPGYDWVDAKKPNSTPNPEDINGLGQADVSQPGEVANSSPVATQALLAREEKLDEGSRRPSMLDVGPSSPPSRGPRVVHRRSHIYDIRRPYFESLGDTLVIESKGKNSHKEASLRRLAGSSSWKAHLENAEWKASQNRNGWEWKGKGGRTIAIEEEQVTGDDRGGKAAMRRARMDIKTDSTEKELDFLVAAWVARVGAEAQERAKEPLTWSKCEHYLNVSVSSWRHS